MARLRVSVLLACLGLAFASGTGAQTSTAQKRLEERRQSLTDLIKKQLLGQNINQTEKFQTDLSFSTVHGMYAYRELLLWARDLPADSAERRDLLAMVRDGLTASVWYSGMGLPIEGWAGEGQPVGMLFDRGEPLYAEIPDFARPATLKWEAKHFSLRVSPESIGFSLAAKSLFALTSADPQDAKLDAVLLASALREFETAQALMKLAAGKGGTYMPALLKKGAEWEVVNENSLAHGQFALLLGLTQLHDFLVRRDADDVVEGRQLSAWRKEVRQALDRTFEMAVAQHFDREAKSFVSQFSRQKGAGDRLGADESGLIMETLAFLAEVLPAADSLRARALSLLDTQAATIQAAMSGRELAPRAFLVKKGSVDAGMVQPIGDQLAIVDGLLAAGKATGKETYGKAAAELFETLRSKYWSEPAGLFRAVPGQFVAGYDGRTFGLGLEAWRRMGQRLPEGDARRHGDHLVTAVVKKGGLLRAQSPLAGEVRQPEEFLRTDLDRLVEELLPLPAPERSKRMGAAVRAFADQNDDGVPGSRFAGGRFGSAPVIVTQTSITVPFEAPASTNPTKE